MEELPGLEDEDDGTFAFSEEKPGIQGQDMGFSTFDAFALAIGLELLGGGFKQLDVVALMRSMKSLLRDEFDWIQEIIQDYGTPDYRGHFWSHKGAPKLPISIVDKEEFADHRVYAIIRKVELREIYPLLKQKLAKRKTGRLPPIYIEPCFVRGITELPKGSSTRLCLSVTGRRHYRNLSHRGGHPSGAAQNISGETWPEMIDQSPRLSHAKL